MGLTFASRHRRRFWRLRTLVVVIVVVAVAVGGLLALHHGSSTSALPTTEVDAFLAAWTSGDAPTMSALSLIHI